MLYNVGKVSFNWIDTTTFKAKIANKRFTVRCSRCRQNNDDKLQKLHNRAARVINKNSDDVSANHLHSINTISLNVGKTVATQIFKTLNGLAPDYLRDLFSIRATKYNVRNLEMKLNLASNLPKPNTKYLKKRFCYSAASQWNNLPNNLRTIESVRSYKKEMNRL